jgi:hypothetical protein
LEFHGSRVSTRRKGHFSSLGPQVSYDSAVGLFAQVRNAAQQVAEGEHADSNLRKVTIKRRKKVLLVTPKWILQALEMILVLLK